ncbi:protein FAM227A [Aplysia californica]|uniref:Protein FAM227A n=1 Tax=Aplysia californica TaxID=6500 RepID=A0ABM0JNZ8_APLCA|nr:protein FAM227A [Aplysia californica]
MSGINRVGSPMDLLDESLDEAPDKVSLRKRLLEAKQRTKSPFLIGSIEEVNKKISRLDHKLQSYTELICESRASAYDNDGPMPSSARGRDQYQKREKETKEVCKFAGVYTLKSTFVPNLSTRVKNISKISMKPKKAKAPVAKKGDGSKPKFVELHQYPGYDPSELTPLPGGLSASEIFDKVVKASVLLNRKPHYKPEFERLFYSQMSQAVLLDIFWYIFVEKFQPNTITQAKLFNRVAHNYVKLMMYNSDLFSKDTFFKDYPKLMSQAVYASFCFAFPDSYRQFGEVFKDELIFLVYEWMAGIRPAPRSWMSWDMSNLEPPNIKLREEMMNRKNSKKASSLIDFDYLDSLISTNASQYASTMSLAQSTSKSSANSNLGPRKTRMHARISKVTHKPMIRSSSPNKSQSPTLSQDSNVIDAVADAQGSPRVRGVNREGKDTKRASEALTPIREMTSEDEADTLGKKISQLSVSQTRDSKTVGKDEMESHPVGRGCDFVRSAFNVEGKSPLVAHFLSMKGLRRDAGQLVWMQRVEVENLPSLDAPTYKDLITDSSKTIKKIEKNYQDMYQRTQQESQVFVRRRQDWLWEHTRKQSALLANQKEVKRLSDLLILEQRKGPDSISVGASAAVEAALMAQE